MGRPSEFNQAIASIYGLIDPRSGELRYIGKAANPAERYKSHMRDAKRRNTPVYCWIRCLSKTGLAPGLVVLAENVDDWQSEERRLITEARSKGVALLNLADGGDEPFCGLETRRSNARALNDALRADPAMMRLRELKRALSRALSRGEVGENTKAKMRLAAKLRPDILGEWAAV